MNVEFLIAICGAIGTLAGVAGTYIQSSKLKEVVDAAGSSAKLMAGTMRIRADGVITVEEQQEAGKLWLELCEEIEEITGKGIVNTKEVEWIKAEEKETNPINDIVAKTRAEGTFDPKVHTAEEEGIDANGGWCRGLKMPDARFANMITGHSADEAKYMRKQVDEAEAAGLRYYVVKWKPDDPSRYYVVENGVVIGGTSRE
jgi:hypothetical protein